MDELNAAFGFLPDDVDLGTEPILGLAHLTQPQFRPFVPQDDIKQFLEQQAAYSSAVSQTNWLAEAHTQLSPNDAFLDYCQVPTNPSAALFVEEQLKLDAGPGAYRETAVSSCGAASAAASSHPSSPEQFVPCTIRTIRLHINGYKNPVECEVADNLPMEQVKEEILVAQRQHPNAIRTEDCSRAVILTVQPTTMNTTCKFKETHVLQETLDNGDVATLSDFPKLKDVYLYLLCPEPPLVNERGQHCRLAKRDAGVCEAHRGQTVRAQKKLKALGLYDGFAAPGVRARVVKHTGESVSMTDLASIQKEWIKRLPTLLRGFLDQHGLEVQALKWTGAKQGSVILDFDLVLGAVDGTRLSEKEAARLSTLFETYIAERTQTDWADAFPAMEISHLHMVPAEEAAAKTDANLMDIEFFTQPRAAAGPATPAPAPAPTSTPAPAPGPTPTPTPLADVSLDEAMDRPEFIEALEELSSAPAPVASKQKSVLDGPMCSRYSLTAEAGVCAYLREEQRVCRRLADVHNHYIALRGGDPAWALDAGDFEIELFPQSGLIKPEAAAAVAPPAPPASSSPAGEATTTGSSSSSSSTAQFETVPYPVGVICVSPDSQFITCQFDGIEVTDSAGKPVKIVHWDTGVVADSTDPMLAPYIAHLRTLVAHIHNSMLRLRGAPDALQISHDDVTAFFLRPGMAVADEIPAEPPLNSVADVKNFFRRQAGQQLVASAVLDHLAIRRVAAVHL